MLLNGVLITDTEDFSPSLIFNCGQCFRFKPVEDGVYRGVAFDRELTISTVPEGVLLGCSQQEFDNIWHDYFDLGLDYAFARKAVGVTDFTVKAAEFGRGIRILRQNFWETVCSFVISQCNNIPRIQGIIERLCETFGENIGDGLYSFPGADIVALLSEPQLRALGTGYRAPYILNAARAVADGVISFDVLKNTPYETAKKKLCSIGGIGSKVADCVLLYGVHRLDAFPLDVWMKRALKEYFSEDFDFRVFGGYAGIAQQYIFHYVRALHGRA